MDADTTCLCGRSFSGPVIDGPMCSPHLVCPGCGKECVVGRIASYDLHAGNRHFYGEAAVSKMQGCHETEVLLLKKIVGSKYEHCVKSDGTVKFKNRAEERGYAKAFEMARAVNAANPGCYMSERSQARDRAIAERRRQKAMSGQR